jgi:phosphatidate cytidylyltransferase
VLIRRIVTALIFGAAIVAAILVLPSVWAGIVLGAVWLMAAYEWSGFARLGRPARVVFVLVIALLMTGIGRLLHVDGFVYVALTIAVAWWSLALVCVLSWPRTLSRPFTVAAGLATLVPAWALLAWLHSATVNGPGLILALLVIVWSADSGAFFCGRAFGRHKLAPNVSPGKTWEGVVGGMLTAAVAGALVAFMNDGPTSQIAVVAAATAAVSVLGDLNVSMFKRNAGLKDSGHVLPGHGGILDRADSVTAAAAMFVLGLLLAGIIT